MQRAKSRGLIVTIPCGKERSRYDQQVLFAYYFFDSPISVSLSKRNPKEASSLQKSETMTSPAFSEVLSMEKVKNNAFRQKIPKGLLLSILIFELCDLEKSEILMVG